MLPFSNAMVFVTVLPRGRRWSMGAKEFGGSSMSPRTCLLFAFSVLEVAIVTIQQREISQPDADLIRQELDFASYGRRS
jgi:hypothetical protein